MTQTSTPKPRHGGAALSVLPFALPGIGDDVVHQGAEAFLEAVTPLLPAPSAVKKARNAS